VVGLVTGGLTCLFALLFLVASVEGGGNAATAILGLGGLPCAVGLIAGAVAVLRRRPGRMLSGSAVLTAGLLLLLLISGLAPVDSEDGRALAGFVVVALPLPVVTAALVRRQEVAQWIAAGPAVS
jgi:hypothetical protein